ncbi:MAG: hypothetical protein QOJ15_11298 [Bradyrhizobium sp.]|nr:hypothetical protein [Bradyrhizobium sp.]
MVRWHHLIEIKGIKELTLSISSTPHHASLPSINQSIERNHGLKIVSMGVLQQNPLGSGHLSARRPRVAGPPWYGPSLTGVFKVRTCRLFDRKVGGLGLPGLARCCVPELGLAQGDRFNRQTLADAMQSITQIYASVGSSRQDGTTA